MKLLPLELLDERQDAKNRREGYLTFAGWQARNRVVREGEKASRWSSKGRALFSKIQTKHMGDYSEYDCDCERDELFNPMGCING